MTHRNSPTTIFDYTVPNEGLGDYVGTMYNPIANNTVSGSKIQLELI
jgi:hypothetical protein